MRPILRMLLGSEINPSRPAHLRGDIARYRYAVSLSRKGPVIRIHDSGKVLVDFVRHQQKTERKTKFFRMKTKKKNRFS